MLNWILNGWTDGKIGERRDMMGERRDMMGEKENDILLRIKSRLPVEIYSPCLGSQVKNWHFSRAWPFGSSLNQAWRKDTHNSVPILQPNLQSLLTSSDHSEQLTPLLNTVWQILEFGLINTDSSTLLPCLLYLQKVEKEILKSPPGLASKNQVDYTILAGSS